MTLFHSDHYIKYLKLVAPGLVESRDEKQKRESRVRELKAENEYCIGENDCPCFPGMFEFSQISCGASIDAAIKLNHKSSDICINWAGGLQHAKKQSSSGFCYVNDIVLAILELLKYH